MAPPFLVWARASLLGIAMLGSGAVSHVSAGGLLPPAAVLVLLTATCAALAARFLLGPASTARIVTLVVAGQTLVHTALSLLAGHRGDAGPAAGPLAAPAATLPVDADGRRVGSLQDAYHAGGAGVATPEGAAAPWDGAAHLLQHVAEQGLLMLVAHVAGAVALGVWLAVGERALWALIHLAATRVVVAAAAHTVAAALRAVLRGVATIPLPRPRATGFRPVQSPERPTLSRRGPPVLLTA